MSTKEELKQEFEKAWSDTAQKEEAAMALTTSGSLSLVTWGDRETVIATGIRIKTVLPGGDKLTIPQALAAGQYAVATGLNPIRGEFYPMVDSKGRFSIVDGYKALTRWAQDECPFDVQYRPLEPEAGEAYRIKCIIMRDDRRGKLDYYLERGADFQTAFDLVTVSAVGVVMEDETRYVDSGKAKDPPKGWTWEQRAETRALKNALNRSHGMPTVAELARKSWEVAGILTRPEDWEGTEKLATPEERERLAEMQARDREAQDEWDALSPEEQQEKFRQNQQLLYGDEDADDPFRNIIDAEPWPRDFQEGDTPDLSDMPTEDLYGPADMPEDEEAMPLGQALGMVLLSDAPKLGLNQGDPLLLAVRKDAKDLVEYLSKPSNYKSLTNLTEQVQKAASILLENWDEAREIAMRNATDQWAVKGGKEIVEMEVEEGEAVPLF